MPYLKLQQLLFNDLYITSFATYPELKAAKERAKEKNIRVGFAGNIKDVHEWQAARWVEKFADVYRNYNRPAQDSRSTGLTALGSLQTARYLAGNHDWILIFQK